MINSHPLCQLSYRGICAAATIRCASCRKGYLYVWLTGVKLFFRAFYFFGMKLPCPVVGEYSWPPASALIPEETEVKGAGATDNYTAAMTMTKALTNGTNLT